MGVEERLQEQGWVLPSVVKPIANYLPALLVGDFVYCSGVLPMEKNELKYKGKIGKEVSLEQGKEAAALAALHLLARLKEVLNGGWDRVEHVVQLTGYVACCSEFEQHSLVVNGASDLLCLALGEKGKHTRQAVGVANLPLGSCIELALIVAVKSS